MAWRNPWAFKHVLIEALATFHSAPWTVQVHTRIVNHALILELLGRRVGVHRVPLFWKLVAPCLHDGSIIFTSSFDGQMVEGHWKPIGNVELEGLLGVAEVEDRIVRSPVEMVAVEVAIHLWSRHLLDRAARAIPRSILIQNALMDSWMFWSYKPLGLRWVGRVLEVVDLGAVSFDV